MLWESWVLLILFIGGLITILTALAADLRESDCHQGQPAGFRFELSTGSSYPMMVRPAHGRHRAVDATGRWRR
ncbi:hypothetical protein OHB26_14510 [Nocardia sp. NBC_01503]|uniref:hypothetical protein n=1 Tax=Nocardia sp. NBC_01503 TaxID=2975997 RepID=UPI002E7ABEF6|nr:hypothetical protein [Nocardia sp. NBC_01503]WTL35296.1 hypothetical protein OHB26_14510 [Nocardia sp. NBC_01503]